MLKLYHSARYCHLLGKACDNVLGYSIIMSHVKVIFSTYLHIDLFHAHPGDSRLQTAEDLTQSAHTGKQVVYFFFFLDTSMDNRFLLNPVIYGSVFSSMFLNTSICCS